MLIMILLLAALVRYWGIGFGLPYTGARPDEDQIVKIIISIKHSLHPGWLIYPSLYKYIVLFFYLCYFFLGTVSGRFKSLEDLLGIDPSIFFLINRCVSAFLGTATVFIVYKLAKDLTNKRTALISALFTGLAYLHVRNSHFGTTDVPVTFFVVWAVLYILKSYRTGTLKDYLFAGILTGLATSTKYTGALLVFPMLVAHLFNASGSKEKKQIFFIDKRILYFAIAAASMFLLGTPYALLDLPQFKTVASWFINISFPHRILLADFGHSAWFYFRVVLWFGLGWSLLFASLGGIFILTKKDFRKGMILFSFLAVYYILHIVMRVLYERYMVPLVPFLCIAASVCINDISAKLGGNLNQLFKKALLFFLVALSVWPSLYNILQFDRIIARKDSRFIASQWILRNIKDGSSIRMLSYCGLPIIKKQLSWIKKIKMEQSNEHDTVNYEFWLADAVIDRFEFSGIEQNSLPDYIITARHPLHKVMSCGKITEIIKTSYELRQAFEVNNINNRGNLFISFDAFYMPFAGFKETTNPGPNIYIYQRKDMHNYRATGNSQVLCR